LQTDLESIFSAANPTVKVDVEPSGRCSNTLGEAFYGAVSAVQLSPAVVGHNNGVHPVLSSLLNSTSPSTITVVVPRELQF
jgi:hypothetical protein